MTPQDAEQRIAAELERGERILWTGVPRQGLLFRDSDLFLIPFSLMWGGFAILWEAMVIATKGPLIARLWGIPFVVIGLYLMFGRFVVDSMMRARMAYGLTDRRVVIVSGVVSRTIKTLPLRTLADLSLTEKADGSGTITLGPSHPMARWSAGAAWPGTGWYAAPRLELIPGVRDVYRRLREAQTQEGSPP